MVSKQYIKKRPSLENYKPDPHHQERIHSRVGIDVDAETKDTGVAKVKPCKPFKKENEKLSPELSG